MPHSFVCGGAHAGRIGADDVVLPVGFVPHRNHAYALRGSFAIYRALDATIAQNQQRKERRLTLPVLAIGGAEGIGEGAANTMKLAADEVQSVVIPGSGHYCLEEAPEEVWAALTAFLAPYRG